MRIVLMRPNAVRKSLPGRPAQVQEQCYQGEWFVFTWGGALREALNMVQQVASEMVVSVCLVVAVVVDFCRVKDDV